MTRQRILTEPFAHRARTIVCLLAVAIAMDVGSGHVMAEELDRVTLKGGSVVLGKVVDMIDGTLNIKTVFGGDDTTTIQWSEVAELTTSQSLTWILTEGTTFQGSSQSTQAEGLALKYSPTGAVVPTPLDTVVAINPPEKEAVSYSGNVNFGASAINGNTDVNSATLLGEFTARAEKLRLSLRGRYIYADDDGDVNTRNALASVKLDFFLTDRFYLFTSAFGEQDTFQDLNLRTALSAGQGYQFIEKKDFSRALFSDMELYGEAGLAFINENFNNAAEANTLGARWSIKWDWQLFPSLAFFHFHEAFPGFERARDLYLTTEQGLRLTLFKNLIATTQVNWRVDHSPAPGFEKTDTLYLLTLGYEF